MDVCIPNWKLGTSNIVHDYEGVDLGFIENIVREYLPKLKEKLSNIG
jgi:uncharacterized protein with HEPN domain